MTILNWFDQYVARGWDIIPLHPASKRPVYHRWQQGGFYDRLLCRNHVERNPNCNLGLLLGSVVDVEGDSKLANEILEELIGDCEHPHYCSHKSIHHLFKNPDPHLTRVAFDDIEFRGHRHHSVVPPSLHEKGSIYTWQHSGEAPEMPQALLKFFLDNRAGKRSRSPQRLKPGFLEAVCGICKKKKPIQHKRYKLELAAFGEMKQSWTCHDCREVDVRPACRKFKRGK
jgi:hypothetical protein